jgi:hypothetical protein
VTNRRSVDTYRVYQDECIELAETINQMFHSEQYPDWKPLVFVTDGEWLHTEDETALFQGCKGET